jgi:glutathione S-transferase
MNDRWKICITFVSGRKKMIKLYYNNLSPLARRVWIALLEKKLEFEPILVNLNGEQLQPEFLAINSFHHVPVLIDGDFRVLESLAILDYLEAKYPQPSLLPADPEHLATVRMIQMVIVNELTSQVIPLIVEKEDSPQVIKSKSAIDIVLNFLSNVLRESTYFGREIFTLGDIVAGNSLILLSKLGMDLDRYSNLTSYCDRLMKREAWQKTQPNTEDIAIFKRRVKALVKLRDR